jgi:hypothetical protein
MLSIDALASERDRPSRFMGALIFWVKEIDVFLIG